MPQASPRDSPAAGGRFPALPVNLVLSLVTALLFLGVLEGGSRLLERARPAPEVADYLWDWEKKWEGDFYTIRSDAVGWPTWEEINADGVRDRTHAEEKPEGTTRLVFLGDSVTLGAGIEPEAAFPQLLQARFEAEGRPIEVFNLALWGWSTRQERLAYERIGRRYRPDTVVLGVCLNDVPELQNNLDRPPRWLAALHERSALVRVLVNAQGREIARVEELFTEKDAPKVRAAFEKYFAEVDALRTEVERDGARFSVVVFPFRFQVEAGAPPPVAQERLLAHFRQGGVEALDLLPAVKTLGPAAFWDYDHFSEKGSRLVADTLAASALVPAVPSARERLREALGPRASETAELLRLLRGRDADLQRAAAWGLGRLGAEAAPVTLGPLRAALGDPIEGVRAESATALGSLGPAARPAAGDLFRSLDDSRQDVRWRAARALARLPLTAGEHLEPLRAAVRSPDFFVRTFACWTLGNLGPAAAAAVPDLVAALPLRGGFARAGAVGALARIGEAAAPAVPALSAALSDPDGDRRWQAARALGRIGPAAAAAVPALVHALGDPNEHVRLHSARALGRVGDLSAGAALEKARADPHPGVRKEAAKAIGELQRTARR